MISAESNQSPVTSAILAAVLLFGCITTTHFGLSQQFITLTRTNLLTASVGGGLLLASILWFVLRGRLRQMGPSGAILSALSFLLLVPYVLSAAQSFLPVLVLVLGAWWLFFGRINKAWWHYLLLVLPLYLITMARDVGSADTFEFQVTAPQMGIAHPSGYPLYLLLGKLWTLLPFGSVAWRLNLGNVVYALVAFGLLFILMRRLGNDGRRATDDGRAPAQSWRSAVNGLPSLVAVLALATSRTLWSQSIEAEVYSLHAIFVVGGLLLMMRLLDHRPTTGDDGLHAQSQQSTVNDQPSAVNPMPLLLALSLLIGLGLTNHLTTAFLLPAAAVMGLFVTNGKPWGLGLGAWGKLLAAFFSPLLLYAYLPIRWLAVNGEPMGWWRFREWVTGERFAGALQWRAWLDDSARWGIIGRLFYDEWGDLLLVLALIGFLLIIKFHWRFALILGITWVAFSFYCLNYYVPDLNVFLIPAHVVVAICIGAVPVIGRQLVASSKPPAVHGSLITVLICIWLIGRTASYIDQLDRSQPNPLLDWGRIALSQPLAQNAAILADSEKHPPLYYLQQAEGIRPDLDIMVLPDEAAYRFELDSRVAAGQQVYLARYLPNLPYELSAAGPLAAINPPPTVWPAAAPIRFGSIGLLEAFIDKPIADGQLPIRLQWLKMADGSEDLLVHLRWQHDQLTTPATKGQHPVHNFYPTRAWQVEQRVHDFYLLDRPIYPVAATFELQVALAPAFTAASELDWQSVASAEIPAATSAATTQAVHIEVGEMIITGLEPKPAYAVDDSVTVRPNTKIPVTVEGYAPAHLKLELSLGEQTQTIDVQRGDSAENRLIPFAWQTVWDAPQQSDSLWLRDLTQTASPASHELFQIYVSGPVLTAGAINYGDQIALLDVGGTAAPLVAGGVYEVEATWQALSEIWTDYTSFAHILDADGKLVAQTDQKPVQGTYPTNQWQLNEIINDPIKIQIPAELPPGNYQLALGFYNLADLGRLPVFDELGNAINDKVIFDLIAE